MPAPRDPPCHWFIQSHNIHIYTPAIMLKPPPVEPPNSLGPPPNRLERRSKATSFEAVLFKKKRMSFGSVLETMWVFPKIMVPQNGWFIMEIPIKTDALGVPLFLETPTFVPFQNPHPTLVPSSQAAPKLRFDATGKWLETIQWMHPKKKMPPWEVGLHRYGLLHQKSQNWLHQSSHCRCCFSKFTSFLPAFWSIPNSLPAFWMSCPFVL